MAPKKKGPLKGPKGGRKGKPAPPKKKNKSLSGQGESEVDPPIPLSPPIYLTHDRRLHPSPYLYIQLQ